MAITIDLPCAIGDSLYRPSGYKDEYIVYEFRIDCMYISAGDISIYTHQILPNGKMAVSYEVFSTKDIGKLIFLTEKEAEEQANKMRKQLRERRTK